MGLSLSGRNSLQRESLLGNDCPIPHQEVMVFQQSSLQTPQTLLLGLLAPHKPTHPPMSPRWLYSPSMALNVWVALVCRVACRHVRLSRGKLASLGRSVCRCLPEFSEEDSES